MKHNEVLILKSHEVREILITSTVQIVKFQLSPDSTIEVYLNSDRRLEVRSLKLNQPLNIKPSAANTVEIFPEMPENYYSVDETPAVVLPKRVHRPKKTAKTTPPAGDDVEVIVDTDPGDEIDEKWGVTASKMTMKEKPNKKRRR